MNPTVEKFGWPRTLVREFDHWLVLVRPAQPTLGSLVLAAKSDATAFSELPPGAHAELATVSAAIEAGLRRAVGYSKINYLMLMMVDQEVHYHVIPRYEGEREWNGIRFPDAGWPKLPDLNTAVALEELELEALVSWLRDVFAPDQEA